MDFSSIRAHSLVRRPPMPPASARIVGWSRRRIQRSENGSRNSDYNSGWWWELCDLLNSLILVFILKVCASLFCHFSLCFSCFQGGLFRRRDSASWCTMSVSAEAGAPRFGRWFGCFLTFWMFPVAPTWVKGVWLGEMWAKLVSSNSTRVPIASSAG